MGQARLKGTKEQRIAAAEAVKAQRQAEADAAADAAEREEQDRIAREWATLTPKQKEARLEKAKRMAQAYGEMSDIFGHEAASVLMGLTGKR